MLSEQAPQAIQGQLEADKQQALAELHARPPEAWDSELIARLKGGMRAEDIDSFGKWMRERDGIAKQTAAASPAIP